MAAVTWRPIKSKYILIHFTRNKWAQVEAAVTVNGTTIPPSLEAKYLSIIFDQKLKFCPHVKQIVAKGTKYAFAIAGITKSKWALDSNT